MYLELKPEVRTFVPGGGGGGREKEEEGFSRETNFVRFAGLVQTFAMALKYVYNKYQAFISGEKAKAVKNLSCRRGFYAEAFPADKCDGEEFIVLIAPLGRRP